MRVAAIADVVDVQLIVRGEGILHAQQPLLNIRGWAVPKYTARAIAVLLIRAVGVAGNLRVLAGPGIARADIRIGSNAAVQAQVGVGCGGETIRIN